MYWFYQNNGTYLFIHFLLLYTISGKRSSRLLEIFSEKLDIYCSFEMSFFQIPLSYKITTKN